MRGRCQRVIRAGVLAAAAMAAAGGGCGSTPARLVSPPRPVDPEGPRVVGGDAGLEVQWWIVNQRPARVEFASGEPEAEEVAADAGAPASLEPVQAAAAPAGARASVIAGESIGEVLAPYLARPVPLTDEERERWRLNGLRLVSVPLEDLPLVRARLSIAGPLHAQWLGEPPAWTVVAAGPGRPRGFAFSGDEGVVEVGPGRLRLVARCWGVPLVSETGPAAGLRLEVAPQHEEWLPVDESLAVEAGLRPGAGGLEPVRMFARLGLDATLGEHVAFLVVPAPPDERWGPEAEARSEAESGGVGPPVFGLPTLGEAMLTAGGSEGRAATRAVVVLVLRVPRRFGLLAPVQEPQRAVR